MRVTRDVGVRAADNLGVVNLVDSRLHVWHSIASDDERVRALGKGGRRGDHARCNVSWMVVPAAAHR